jgi:PAS domain S-box-containing protein
VEPERLAAFHRLFPMLPTPDVAVGRAILERAIVHFEDVLRESPNPTREAARHALGYRAWLAVPMLRDGVPLGVIFCWRSEPRGFTDTQIALVRTFADQAVIAIENVRLFKELEVRNRDLTETLEQQTATSEILRVISSSPTDIQPVFDTIARSAAQLCGAHFCHLFRFDGEQLHFVAHHGLTPEGVEAMSRAFPMTPTRGTASGRATLGAAVAHIPDVLADPDYQYGALAKVATYRSLVAVPMLREGRAIGTVNVARLEAGPFSDRQIELLKTFADQAVIAVENVRLFTELETRNVEMTETLARQTATGEVLRAISRAQTDAQPVFDIIAASALRLCGGGHSGVWLYDGELIHLAALENVHSEGADAIRRDFPRRADEGSTVGRAVVARAVAQIPDVQQDPAYALGGEARTAGFRSFLAAPMLRDGEPIGVIGVGRPEPGAFPENQVELLQTFADQAVIAIENVRLFTELEAKNRDLTETLEQQTATGEILRVISQSPTDTQPVFDTIARNAARLCEARDAVVYLVDGDVLTPVARHGPAQASAVPLVPETLGGRTVIERRTMHVADMLAETGDLPVGAAISQREGTRSMLSVPLLHEGRAIGTIGIRRFEVRPFSDTHIALLQTFAAQAVIAIENVRLFKELEAKNRDLTETLEQQTATSEILRVISSSPTDVQPVFDTIAQSAKRLCNAQFCAVFRYDGERLHFVAHHGLTSQGVEAYHRAYPMTPGRGSAAARSILNGAVEHIPDVDADPNYAHGAIAQVLALRSIVAVPMLRDGRPIGSIAVSRSEAGRFLDTQIALLQMFADQAVIAIENVRLFKELEARTQDLTQSVGELRALGEVSQAVSSTLDLENVLETIVSRAVQLSGSDSGIVYEFDEASQSFHARAAHQVSPEHLEVVRAGRFRLGEGAVGRAGMSREPVQVADTQAEWQLIPAHVRAIHAREGTRSLLAVPLVREGQLLGGLVIQRHELAAFSPEVVATLQAFATQSVLAIHNAGLFREIQRRKQYADAIVETSPVAIVTVDLNGRVVGWNPGAEQLFGHTEAESLGRPMEDLVATPDVLEDLRNNIRRTLAGESIRAIGRRARKDGTPVDVEISSVPVVVDGARMGMVGIYHDITDLLRARREAEAANEAKSAFLATMSHEIRTPMNAVIGMSGLLLNTALTDEQREYAEVVRQSGDALLTVINDILDFSKIEAGRLELEAQPFDLRECVEGALDLVATRAAEKGLDLAYLVGEGTPPAVVGDVTRLRQVLLNLLSNAVKFTERGEVVVSVSARRVDGSEGLHEVTFSIRDTGIGIPPDRVGRLFQSFSQVDASTTRRYGGTGLGLAISQRLTELMGGRISVTSEVGTGSEFRFSIRAPAAEPLPVEARRDLSGIQHSIRGRRVLVVDDNATNRRIVTTHLGTWGLPARATESPREALAWVQSGERYDVGILDMHMPEMDGVALARAIRGEPAGAALPLILFTSLGRREARAEEEGFAAYLHKPIKPSQLFDALVSVLGDQPVHVRERGIARTELDPGMARRHPLRILLAEDNVVNQKVALRLLAQMGYRADVAANGLEAVDAVERQTYDVVLMDVQMPELDGFEASREINRRWAQERPRIVAMTANAMQGDRELCAAAGMDDYVAKPIRIEELVTALESTQRRGTGGAPGGGAAGAADPLTGRIESAAAGATAGSPESRAFEPREAPAAEAIDRATFDGLVRSMGGAFVAELIDTFVEDARELTAQLPAALARRDVDGFRRAAHSLKSTSESLGAMALASLARELEAIARAGSLDGAGEGLAPVAAEYARVAHALRKLRRDLSA